MDAAQAIAVLASLHSKSEKSLAKVPPGSWQQARLANHVEALRVVLRLLAGEPTAVARPHQLLVTLQALQDLAHAAAASFRSGTSHHSLQQNRVAALDLAKAAVRHAMRAGTGSAAR